MTALVPKFPGEVWDGLSENQLRESLQDDINPNAQDWDRIVTEVISMQTVAATQGELDTVSGDLTTLSGDVDTLSTDFDALNDSFNVTMQNDDPMVAIPPGTPVYVSGANLVDLAKADAASTAVVLGLATASIAGDEAGVLRTSGALTLTTGQWDAVTGGSGGLTAGSVYYLSEATAGLLTTTAPSMMGEQVVPVGIALNATTLLVRVDHPFEIA